MSDICLLLEGTYPYVSGGVSSWVHDLIKRMSDFSFSLVYVGAKKNIRKKLHYTIPGNVTEMREIYLFDYFVGNPGASPSRKPDLDVFERFLEGISSADTSVFNEFARKIHSKEIKVADIVFSRSSWDILRKSYEKTGKEESFLDYFWTWRFMYLPLVLLLLNDLPRSRLYHSVSTGYAGVLGAIGKLRYSRPFILTEHGIYNRERRIDISQADWIYSRTAADVRVTDTADFFRDWWMQMFQYYSKLAYNTADKVITIYEGNRKAEILEGCAPARTSVIPNGVDYDALSSMPRETDPAKVRIGFMGRIVPIKDVKTFIMACGMVFKDHRNIEVFIMGPTDEDPDYYDECSVLVEMQGLAGVITFTGKINPRDYYRKIDIIVLTSISEGQPIVALEANACGIPVVATDVGACSEILFGKTKDDSLIGPSGIITPVSSPLDTAAAIVRLIKEKGHYAAMASAGKKRIARYYDINKLIGAYRKIYSEYVREVRWPE